ncbi:hypothetical protein LCGC14_1101780 [marine sediment metagenome]|uniref:Terminase large subunit gp17-like C-terminal domain-containing protein n=1 Tax=marine sediment metagenome TaxID=412755 RepID=A0A0F9M978_9ZZZZ
MNILAAIHDNNLFRSYVAGSPDGSLDSWANWLSFLRVLYGLRVPRKADREIVRRFTGRDPAKLSKDGYQEALVLAGRRGGKSKVIALVGAAEAILSGKEKGLSRGEIPMVAILSPTRNQSRIIHTYLRGVFDSTPMLQNEVVEEKREGFTLRNGVEVSVITGDPRKVRGFTLLACIVDEIAMFGFSEEAKINDLELVRAIRPALASTGGRLLLVGTPYASRGYSYHTWKRAYGSDSCDVLCWNAPSILMNPTLSKAVVARAIAEDPIAANVEYCTSPGLFREDVDDFVSRAVVESLVVRGRKELAPRSDIAYAAFADVSGGRHDDAALAIAHLEDRVVILDCLERYKSPHNPYEVVAKMCQTVRRYSLEKMTGDAYSAEWSRVAFQSHGIDYLNASTSHWKKGVAALKKTPKPKSVLYAELLPRLHSAEIELLDDETLITQLSALQRRTRSSGKDQIDHPPGQHDDLANTVAGVATIVTQRKPFEVRSITDPRHDDSDVPAWKQEIDRILADEIELRQYEKDQIERTRNDADDKSIVFGNTL